jgi:hypothetical protein
MLYDAISSSHPSFEANGKCIVKFYPEKIISPQLQIVYDSITHIEL